MDPKQSKPRVAIMFLALLMLFFGGLMSLFGFAAVYEWRAEQLLLIASGAVWILAGPVVFGSALWLLRTLGRSRRALRIGGISVAVTGTVLAAAAITHVMPCTGVA
ncbi:MAG TPA: hypothetical protein VGF08_12800 [Terriglobales bacterium]|jgi:hypothetical protein